jgi:hypothetical protein
MSSREWPVTPAAAQAVIDAEFPDQQQSLHGPTASGLTERLEPLRDALRQAAYIPDSGKIPHSKKFVQKVTCREKHPGLCATLDSEIKTEVLQLAACVHEATRTWSLPCVFLMVAHYGDAAAPCESCWCAVAQFKECLALVPCSIAADQSHVNMESKEEFDFRATCTVLRGLRIQSLRSLSLQRVVAIPRCGTIENMSLMCCRVSVIHEPVVVFQKGEPQVCELLFCTCLGAHID